MRLHLHSCIQRKCKECQRVMIVHNDHTAIKTNSKSSSMNVDNIKAKYGEIADNTDHGKQAVVMYSWNESIKCLRTSTNQPILLAVVHGSKNITRREQWPTLVHDYLVDCEHELNFCIFESTHHSSLAIQRYVAFIACMSHKRRYQYYYWIWCLLQHGQCAHQWCLAVCILVLLRIGAWLTWKAKWYE